MALAMTLNRNNIDKPNMFLLYYFQVMLRYRSPILKMLEVVVYSPLLLSGYSEEKQVLTITLLEDFIDNSVS